MKNAEIYLNLLDLSIKYANVGLTIDIEFSRYGMIFRGYWDLTLNKFDIRRFNREYTRDFIKTVSNAVDVECLIDEFKDEFERKLKEAEE